MVGVETVDYPILQNNEKQNLTALKFCEPFLFTSNLHLQSNSSCRCICQACTVRTVLKLIV